MSWIVSILQEWQHTVLWLAGLAACFAVAERFWPCNAGMAWWKDPRAVATDMVYWFIMPLFLRFARQLMLLAGVALIFGAGDPVWIERFFREGYGPLRELPLWLQAVLILVFSDVLLYWIHRFFHQKAAWRFHAIHHSPETLDWMSTQRFHFVNILLAFGLVDTIMLLAGFAPAAMIALAPFNIAYSAFVHANLNWTFGPFRYVLASPVFHRWHHTHPKEGGNKNFAPTFPILDVVFGTFYMPEGKLPQHYGVTDRHFPKNFWGQLAYPFRVAK